MSSVGSGGESQSAASRAGADMLSAKDVTQKKPVTDSTTQSAADSQQPQMFEEVLSNAATTQKSEAKTPAAKAKPVTADAKDSAKADVAPSPDITLLMSLLSVLPQNTPAPTSLTPQDDAVATTVISPNVAAAIPSANPAAPQTTPVDPLKAADPTVIAAALPDTAANVVSMTEGRVVDKADLFASVLAGIDSPAPTPAPLLAVPTHQPSTLTAVAQALPLTAPGVLDELPMANREWPAALGHRLLWAVSEGMQKVDISVNPQDMGPINVQIRIENDKADIRFTALHSMTREALEASIPRLRDMFSQQGLNLSQAQVFSQTSHDSSGRQPDPNPSNPHASNDSESQEVEQTRPMHWRRGLVDDYA